jgi:hypothetical protein
MKFTISSVRLSFRLSTILETKTFKTKPIFSFSLLSTVKPLYPQHVDNWFFKIYLLK